MVVVVVELVANKAEIAWTPCALTQFGRSRRAAASGVNAAHRHRRS